jgi:TonB-linked SusC/RagA family outer membrane protein
MLLTAYYAPNRLQSWGLTKKLLRIMKITAFILLIACMQVSAKGRAQTVTISVANTSIEKVFQEVKKQTGYDFFYEENVLQGANTVSLNATKIPLEEALRLCFKNQQLTYTIIEKTVVVKKKNDDNINQLINLLTSPAMDVHGKLVNEKGEAIDGISVTIKGTDKTVVSNQKGEFSFSGVGNNATVVFTGVSIETYEVSVNGKSDLGVIALKTKVSALSEAEVVAVGYGTQRKQAVTGAVAKANLKTYEKVATTNILDLIKGTMPGVNIGAANTAGGVPGISIRGQNSISAGSSPLIVVDDVVFKGSLNDLPTNDIESFTVLKDASAAAVYGSRSSNGVILITTKKGKGYNGKPSFNVSTAYGTTSELQRMRVEDSTLYMKYMYDYRTENGLPVNAPLYTYLQPMEIANYLATPEHTPTLADPYNLFRQTGTMSNTTLSVSNQINKTSYYISGNYTRQKGVIINDMYKHYSARVNVQTDLTDWFTFGIKSYYSLNDMPASAIYGATSLGSSYYNFSPWASIKDSTGAYNQFPQTTTSFNNPFWQIPTEAYSRQNTLNGILNATIKCPWVKGLSYSFTWSNNLNWNESGSFYGLQTVNGSAVGGTGSRSYSRTYSYLTDNILRYNRTFGKHTIDATALIENEYNKSYSEGLSGKGFTNTALGTWNLGAAATQSISSGGAQTVGVGYMGRATYTFNNLYSVTGTFRRDGYSAFSANNKYADFPSVGVNWHLSNEAFMKNVKFLNNLDIRASYGSNGNQSISPYSTLALLGNSKYIFAGDGGYTVTQYISQPATNNLKWESVTGINIGVDFSILKNRISGAIDYYDKNTHDLIYAVNIPSISGFSSTLTNIGKLNNKGIEIALNTINITKKDFSWESNIAFSRNRNKLITLLGYDNNHDGKEDDIIASSLFIGKSLGSIYTYKVIGMWQQEDKDKGTIMTGMNPGTYKLLDINGDGKITSDSDRTIIGNGNPNFRWSFTNVFRYKKLSLMVYVNSIWGGNNWYLSGSNTPYNDPYNNRPDMNHPVYDYWTPTNTGAMFPRLNYNSAPANGGAQYRGVKYFDRSFIKLQKLALTYDFSDLVKNTGFKGLNVSISADNIFTYAPHWVGMDPETNNGINDGSIPSLRNVMCVLNFNF